MGFNPANGGIAGASDIAFNNPQNSQVISYSSSTAKWANEDKPVAFSYYNSGWSARPRAATVIWVGGAVGTPPSGSLSGDLWLRDVEV